MGQGRSAWPAWIRECHRWTTQLLPEVGQRFRIRIIARTGVERDQTRLSHGLIRSHRSYRRVVDMLDCDIDYRRGAAQVSITDDELKTQRCSLRGDVGATKVGWTRITEIERDWISSYLSPRERSVGDPEDRYFLSHQE